MAFLVNDDIFHVKTICRLGEQVAMNTFMFKVSNQVGVPSVADGLQKIAADIGAKIKLLMSNAAEYRGCTGYLVKGGGTVETLPEYSVVNQGAGAYASDALPKQICGLITRRTQYRGRDEQGRIYVPFPAESASDPTEGRPNAAYLTLLSALGQTITDPINVVNGGDSCTLTPGKFVTDEPVPFNFHEYVQYVARPYWATQRRRSDYAPRNISPI